jgi:hypothetical protein
MDETTNGHSVENIVEHVRALELRDQLEVLERLAVAVLPDLDDDDRNEFISDLNAAFSRALAESRAHSR